MADNTLRLILNKCHLNHLGFLTAQADLIAHHLIFYGVLQGSIEQYLNHFSLDKSHLHNALAEAAVTFYFDYCGLFTCMEF